MIRDDLAEKAGREEERWPSFWLGGAFGAMIAASIMVVAPEGWPEWVVFGVVMLATAVAIIREFG